LKNFTDYLVLGDDVVVVGKEVASNYRLLIERIGVSISEHKSIVPSELIGMEFASKLITKEGDLSPLPILLRVQGGIACKMQFLMEVVKRVVANPYSRSPRLDVLLDASFGKRLRSHLSGI
jgi:hypothetical protein